MKLQFVSALLLCLSVSLSVSARNHDKDAEKIIGIAENDNQVMKHLDILANRIGGRVIGSDALENAELWAASRFKSWGLEVEVQEVGEIAVGFNRGPWFGRMLGEDGMTLKFVTPSYTAGTKGIQRGRVLMEPKTVSEFNNIRHALKGAWVLIGGKSDWPVDISPEADSIRAAKIAENERIAVKNEKIRQYNRENPDKPKDLIPLNYEPALFYREMIDAGILGIIQASQEPLRALYDRKNCFNMTFDNLPVIPDIKLNSDQYDIIAKKVREREYFELEFDIRNHFRPKAVKFHNVLGIIKGSEFPDEYVIMGGHLDSFDSSTGAVDCGNGTAVTMEAARLIAKSGIKPKRTIIFALWTGEEFGLLGSSYWVNTNKNKLDRIANYFNRDGGPTPSSSLTVTEAMYEDFEKICRPIMNYNPEIPFILNKREGGPRVIPKTAGGSDHAHFMINGVPTFSFGGRDIKGYNFSYGEIWHTNRDTYDKAIAEYLEYSSVINAVVILGVANLDHLLSREGLFIKE